MNCIPGSLTRAVLISAAVATGCGATSYERDAFERIEAAPPAQPRRAAAPADLDGSLAGYLGLAMERSPALEARFAEWRAAVHRIAAARGLPEPVLTFGVMARDLARHRVRLEQMLPWPTEITAAEDAAAAASRAAEAEVEVMSLALRHQIAQLYWQIWLHDHIHDILGEQQELLRALSEAVRSRVEIGRASLADLGQIDLGVTRLDDALATHMTAAATLRAELASVLSVPPSTPLPVTDEPPPPRLPAPSAEELIAAARANPEAAALIAMARAGESRARAANARGRPDVMLGVEYRSDEPMPSGASEPMVMVMVGVTLPVWRGAYRGASAAAEAESAAYTARAAAAADQLAAEAAASVNNLRDAVRRVSLYESTLIPQAESVYDAVTGAYQTGDSTLAAVLLAERDVLELRLELARARSDHARAWAALERAAGRSLPAQETP